MTKTKFLAPVLAAALLASCASISLNPVPTKLSSDDCLVLIRTAVENKTSLGNMASIKHYGFRFSDGQAAKEVSNSPVDFIPVIVKNDKTKIIELYAYIDRSMATGDDTKNALNVQLPYQAGAVIVADFSFVQTLTEPSPGRVYTSLKFEDTTPSQKDDILKRFAKEKNAATWRP